MAEGKGLVGLSDRERLIEALIAICSQRNADEITAEAVCLHSGVAMQTFANQFGVGEGGLEACAVAAENEIVGEVIAAVAAAYSADKSEWDSGIAGILAILEYMAANPRTAYFGYITVPFAVPKGVRETAEAARVLLSSMIDRLRETSPHPSTPQRAARAVLGGADTLVRREISAGRAEDLPRILPDLIYGATVPYLGQHEALELARRGKRLLEGTPWH